VEIVNNGIVYEPIVADKCEIELFRSGYAGKAVFRVIKDDVIDFTEGNEVRIYVNDISFFKGYVFTKTRNKDDDKIWRDMHNIFLCCYSFSNYPPICSNSCFFSTSFFSFK